MSFSNWLGGDVPGAGCGSISKESDFQWEVTSNCSLEFFFICEFGKYHVLSDQKSDMDQLHCGKITLEFNCNTMDLLD